MIEKKIKKIIGFTNTMLMVTLNQQWISIQSNHLFCIFVYSSLCHHISTTLFFCQQLSCYCKYYILVTNSKKSERKQSKLKGLGLKQLKNNVSVPFLLLMIERTYMYRCGSSFKVSN